MTLGRRMAVISAAVVAVAIAAASVIVWFVVRGDLRGQIDRSLEELAGGASVAPAPPPIVRGRDILPIRVRHAPTAPRHVRNLPPAITTHHPRGPFLALPQQAPGLPGADAQIVTASGAVLRPAEGSPYLPVTGADRQVAAGARPAFFTDAEVGGATLRVYTKRIAPGRAVQIARSLADVDATTRRLALVLAFVAAAGVAVAAVLGRAIARAALAPVAKLTEAAEHVTRTRDLGRRIDVPDRGDELSRLAASFNAMLAELDRALASQRRLVVDASHELRTPLTSLRTNLEVLARDDGLPREDRARLLQDVVAQLGELGVLVGDLVELARDDGDHSGRDEDVELDDLAAAAVERAQRRARDIRFHTDLVPCVVRGNPDRLARAVSNLLDNAVKWSPPGGRVDVELTADGELSVRDRGPGIDPADTPHVFERFYRSATARGRPGSGLGLSIVRDVAEAHAGSVEAGQAPGGGALLRLRLRPIHDSLNSSAPLS